MGKSLKISEARKRLFDLVDEVTSDDEEVVLIEHRDRPGRAALVSEDHLRNLHATIAALRKRQVSEFRLAGSMKMAVSDEEMEGALALSRREQAAMVESKFQDL